MKLKISFEAECRNAEMAAHIVRDAIWTLNNTLVEEDKLLVPGDGCWPKVEVVGAQSDLVANCARLREALEACIPGLEYALKRYRNEWPETWEDAQENVALEMARAVLKGGQQ